ncbi:low molecular weight phosphatase family protein [Microbacterium enclense]|uniref:arsenate reductase/protein-tyrosine-phosphatase family protein n=1 Tax=Microbacterium enclense TaxID=993073 RepID=UPI00203FC8C8|nr:low molecular weight phosphatase family protein [Microbacterium enclense]MCM3613080.1 low molecular weight phosphatase family protein [Microbacterium enclense]
MVGNRIVVVCTANMIRSPFIAGLLRSRMQAFAGRGLEVDSAGTAARPGAGAAPEAIELGKTYGLDLAAHRTRRLDDGVLATGDTVLCAERAHRRVVLDLRPDLLSSVFTVREFAHLVARVPERDAAGDWDGLVRAAGRARLGGRVTPEADDDVTDPIGCSQEVWTAFERQATQAVSAILAAIGSLPPEEWTDTSPPRPPATRRENRMRLGAPSSRRAARTG